MAEETATRPRFDPRGLFQRYRDVFRGWLIFLGVVGFMAMMNEWAGFWVNDQLSKATAQVTAFFLRLLGAKGQAAGTFIRSTHCSFEIIGECTAYYPCAVLMGAILAYPSSVRSRLWGLALCVPALLMINQVRLVSLCYVYRWFREDFETIHILVWQSLIMFFTVLLWILWVTFIARHHESSAT